MPPRRVKHVSLDEVSIVTMSDHASIDSGEAGNQPFFGKSVQPVPMPSHTSSMTWKSNAVKEKEEFERVKQRVRHLAPEQFRANAKPGRGPSGIFPRNVTEWVTHKKDVLAIAQAQKEKSCDLLKAQILAQEKIPKKQRKVKSAFGKDGKVFKDGLSPVLGLPTIWSAEHLDVPANWPSSGELQWNGDSRECMLAKTKCGRFLPPPRAPAEPSKSFQDQPFLKQLPFDQAGPIFSTGPQPDEIQANNFEMNEDPGFEAAGNFYLGSELMSELGEWGPVFVPDWQQEQRDMSEDLAIQFDHSEQAAGPAHGYSAYPAMAGGDWYEGNVQDLTWEDYRVWW
ncbi:hypothetical protein A1O1_07816 [Capronia coronata CBS 617.96]|uniref:Uncharacterized protein n=1 Tax=Capronia coronata CBS 617.96 TaxID=1182541 RepID=W9XXP5_9EURO|nr:uncharacterized protein A1O1_07816 [Capronia coronata CBS 617.96]EXJ81751.1 hypothetical protein A1O1_07816 [Capronia coronata CBS 617.96]